jgi:hypothetical protein
VEAQLSHRGRSLFDIFSLERFRLRRSPIAAVACVGHAFVRGEELNSSARAMRLQTCSKLRGRAARKKAFSFANASSIGLKSGLYGGRNRSRAPACSIAVCTSGCLWTARLSRTTTSPGRSVGTNTCSTYARNVGLSMGPSNTAGALRPSRQCGDRAAHRSWRPHPARLPRRR